MWQKVENGRDSETRYLPLVGRWEDRAPGARLIPCHDSGNKADRDSGLQPDSVPTAPASQPVFGNVSWSSWGEAWQIQARGTQAPGMCAFHQKLQNTVPPKREIPEFSLRVRGRELRGKCWTGLGAGPLCFVSLRLGTSHHISLLPCEMRDLHNP